MITDQFIWLFKKALQQLKEELLAYPDEETIWMPGPGIKNSAGHLTQHLIGNLKTFIGNPFANLKYIREREKEFSERQFSRDQLIQLIDETGFVIEKALLLRTEDFFKQNYPPGIIEIRADQTVDFILLYLYGHLNYHLGQINYHRRLLV